MGKKLHPEGTSEPLSPASISRDLNARPGHAAPLQASLLPCPPTRTSLRFSPRAGFKNAISAVTKGGGGTGRGRRLRADAPQQETEILARASREPGLQEGLIQSTAARRHRAVTALSPRCHHAAGTSQGGRCHRLPTGTGSGWLL